MRAFTRWWLLLGFWGVFVSPIVVLVLMSVGPDWPFPFVLPRALELDALRRMAGAADWVIRGLGSSVTYSVIIVVVTAAACLAPALTFGEFPLKHIAQAALLTLA